MHESSLDIVLSSERISKVLIRLRCLCLCCLHATKSGLIVSRPVSYYVHDHAFKVHASMVQMTLRVKLPLFINLQV